MTNKKEQKNTTPSHYLGIPALAGGFGAQKLVNKAWNTYNKHLDSNLQSWKVSPRRNAMQENIIDKLLSSAGFRRVNTGTDDAPHIGWKKGNKVIRKMNIGFMDPNTAYERDLGTSIQGNTLHEVYIGKGRNATAGTIAHELGHALQSGTLKNLADKGRYFEMRHLDKIPHKGLLTLGLGSYRSDDPNTQKAVDMLGRGFAGIQTAVRIPQFIMEADASIRGHKLLRNAGMTGVKVRGLNKRLGPYAGLATYGFGTIRPIAVYGAARYLPEKIQGLYHSLKNKSKEG